MNTVMPTQDLAGYANPFQGTDSSLEFSNGNTLPLLALPWGMTHWTILTREEHGHGSWTFRYGDRKCQGIRATHQPSPWISDYGHFSILPVVGEVGPEPHVRASSFRYEDMVMRPDYLRLFLRRYDIQVEVTPTERCAHFRLRFPPESDARLLVQSILGPAEMKLRDDGLELEGAVRGWDERGLTMAQAPGGFRCHVVLRSTRKFAGGQGLLKWARQDGPNVEGEGAGMELLFAEGPDTVEVAVATSFISAEQARLNLDREIGTQGFDETRASTRDQWNSWLGRVQLEGADERQMRTFYSALYRSLLFPRFFHELDRDGREIHYSPYSGKVEQGMLCADNGFWDTFRTVYPMLALMYPDVLGKIVNGWVHAAREGGAFPKWASPGYRACMIGTHIDAVVADALVKDIQGFDRKLAYQYVLQNGTQPGPAHRFWGRLGLEHMRARGYVPCDLVRHGTSRTLEFAYNDFCVAQCAALMDDEDTARTFLAHAQSYRNVYDPDVGLMRGRLANGEWLPDFNPVEWSDPFCEGSSIQYSYMVPHDVPGMIELFGGKEKFVAGLEAMLAMPTTFAIGRYDFETHEMSEMAAVDFGQYAHCNQPSHHLLYLFALAGRPDLTRHWVRRVLDELYSPDPDGLPGDEDNGEMSAWYVLSSIGLYSVCPGREDYVLTCPFFRKVRITVPDCAPILLTVDGALHPEARVSEIRVNDLVHPGPELSYFKLREGAHIVFKNSEASNEAAPTVGSGT